jgi:hypothetical protein
MDIPYSPPLVMMIMIMIIIMALQPWAELGLLKQLSPATSILGISLLVSTTHSL